MNRKQIYLILGLVVFSLAFAICLMVIDGIVSSMATEKTELVERSAQTFLLETDYYSLYHLCIILIFVSYVSAIGITIILCRQKLK